MAGNGFENRDAENSVWPVHLTEAREGLRATIAQQYADGSADSLTTMMEEAASNPELLQTWLDQRAQDERLLAEYSATLPRES